jgi:addiction module RelE/StbE family toxin
MAEIIWSPRSLKDIDEIADYISRDSFQYAEAQVSQFFSKVKIIEKQPLAGRMVPELKEFSLRQLLCGHYRIIYEIINPEQVGVITIHHQSRLLKNNPGMRHLLTRKKKK